MAFPISAAWPRDLLSFLARINSSVAGLALSMAVLEFYLWGDGTGRSRNARLILMCFGKEWWSTVHAQSPNRLVPASEKKKNFSALRQSELHNSHRRLLFDLIFLENVSGGQKSVEKMAWNVGIIPAVTTVLVSRQTTRRIA